MTATHWATAYIGLGANLGNAVSTLIQAREALTGLSSVRAVASSPFYRTAPVDSSGPDYVNAVIQLQTLLSPHDLLAALQKIELDFGRERPWRNAPRTLDLDLLLYDNVTLNDPSLTLPHPRMHERAFVLQPLKNLAPDLMLAQGSIDTLLAKCVDQGIEPLP
ncbi:2-amino-4-hydroxy-6-hydroxymethyldihydropteridine diphosphokinase [Pusillimonas sp. NJUB218]|uniref:2-amino-4-hydroxy-6- hydroxymethyldihydropteridine diphosphokinase n=1 Tax=Pusillimonas sp. NJUB218 TaxID=2023230 RepID=UPI000F4C2378|nr:2-amino-4-hydroxy-6-hydroxymethyldihydropteridine diphosphokinase [Pusillimonas sp. NJUB218]ROT45943.1 2-amino-4-hydroxy-6-hydroxymethyldihydropteridine diphosphokinase [Pusillimonas sp. NJUB218]